MQFNYLSYYLSLVVLLLELLHGTVAYSTLSNIPICLILCVAKGSY